MNNIFRSFSLTQKRAVFAILLCLWLIPFHPALSEQASKPSPESMLKEGKISPLQYFIYLYQMQHDYEKAFQLSQSIDSESAGPGYQFLLATLYEFGRGTTPDKDKALSLYRKSAAGGFASAQYRLGKLYELGELGIALDYQQALQWYQKAIDNNFPPAQDAKNYVTKLLRYMEIAKQSGNEKEKADLYAEVLTSFHFGFALYQYINEHLCNKESAKPSKFCQSLPDLNDEIVATAAIPFIKKQVSFPQAVELFKYFHSYEGAALLEKSIALPGAWDDAQLTPYEVKAFQDLKNTPYGTALNQFLHDETSLQELMKALQHSSKNT